MNKNDSLPKSTVELLRAPLPDSEARPGFETRLICNLATAPAESKRNFSWLPFAAAAAVAIALLSALPLLQSPDTPGKVANTPAVPAAKAKPILDLEEFSNPLSKEATAVSHSATRAGQFLINCLPSLPSPEDTL